MSYKINSFTINGSYITPSDFTMGKTPVADVDKFMTSTINTIIKAFEMEASTWIRGKFFTQGYILDESTGTSNRVYYNNVIIGRYATFTMPGAVVNCIVRAYPPDDVTIQAGKHNFWSIELMQKNYKFNTNAWEDTSPTTNPLVSTHKVEIIKDIGGGKHFIAIGYTPEAVNVLNPVYHFGIRPIYNLETHNFVDYAIVNNTGRGILLSPLSYSDITNLNNTLGYRNNDRTDKTLGLHAVLVSTITAFDKYYSPGCGVCGNYYAENFCPDDSLSYKTKLINFYDNRDVYVVRRNSDFDIFYFEEDENNVIQN